MAKDRASYKHAYYEANKEKLSAQNKAYYEANKGKIAAQKQAWAKANREKLNAKQRDYRKKNWEKLNAQRKAYIEANRDKINARRRSRYNAARDKEISSWQDGLPSTHKNIYLTANGTYTVYFARGGQRYYAGTHKTIDEAIAARDAKLKELEDQHD